MSIKPKRSRPPVRRGKVVTFFSFKGGVGRTMALANCAFAAAMSGARVLVMDWDLEAPGLPYYFRGLIDQRGARDIRRAKGVLDLFWGWQQAIDGAKTGDQLMKRLEPYRSHQIFEECVNPLVDANHLPSSAKLDVMSAGAPLIGCPEQLSYAEALSRFNWSDFFDERAGGNLIHQLGRWCRANYDLTLIDSRTGLADVSGICTMQIPDEVYLCFVFNRQNIDGTAQVTSSILAAREDQIKIRLVPMRVSKDNNPAEESDARARAARDFKRAGLSVAQVDADLKALSVPATAGVPYYEALAPFYSNEHSVGDLNWAYLRLTKELLGSEIPHISLDPTWSEDVRKRLQPKISTVEYLRDLQTADPDRAIEEIERFLDGALDADPSIEVDADYIRALVAAVSEALDRTIEDDEAQIRQIADKTLRLIEQMHMLGEGDWRQDFVEAIDDFDYRIARTLEEYQEVLAWQERMLSEGPQTGDILVRRAQTAINLARLARDEDEYDLALAHANSAERLCREAAAADAPDNDVRRLRVFIADLRAKIALSQDPASASDLFHAVLNETGEASDTRLRSIAADAHLALAELNPSRRRDHFVASVEQDPRRALRDVGRLQDIIGSVIDEDDDGRGAVYVAHLLFGDEKRPKISPNYSRSTQTAMEFAKVANRLLRVVIRSAPDKAPSIAVGIADLSARALNQWARRKSQLVEVEGVDAADEMITGYETLSDRLQVAGLGGRQLARLQNAIENARVYSEDEDEDEDE